MNILELAIKHGDYSIEYGINGVQFTNKELQSFAKAVIEDYKASLVPVGTTYVSNSGYMEVELHKTVNEGVPLYALGETND